MALTTLFNEAVELSRAVAETPIADEDPTAALCATVKIAQDTLQRELVDKLPSIVRTAASQGRSTADLLTFSGNEKYDDEFSYLFLVKGPRDREQKYDLYRHGFVPLYDTLSREVHPFKILFTWIPGCNLNKLTLEWGSV